MRAGRLAALISLGLLAAGGLARGAAAPEAPAAARRAMTPVAGDPVKTREGLVSGTRLSSGVKAYLGIPFAAPPTGPLRWRAPQPTAWSGIWNADRKGPECVQVLRPHDINHYFGEEATAEDCLTLNLWAPPEARAGDGRPVIVFIYGGGGTIGSSGMANYDGEAVARRGALFVNFNYRVGLLGFLAHPALSREQGGRSGNYGYLDQNAALRWVRDNIAAFGGDPEKVVIAGQSYGAGSVAAQIFSPMSKGLFRGALMSSACSFSEGGVIGDTASLAAEEAVGLDLQKRLGAADLEAMRAVPADQILAQQAESQLGVSNKGLRAAAVRDGAFTPLSKAEVLERRLGSDVPIIASSNADDIDAARSPLTRARTREAYVAAARRLYGEDADAFLKLYPAATDADVPRVAHEAAFEGGFLASSRTCAVLQGRFNRSAAYVDLFTRKHPYAPGVTFADQDPKTVGAYHTADVPYWLGTLDRYNDLRRTRDWTAADRALSEKMLGALIALAQTGSPSTAALPWPAWTPTAPVTLVLDTPPRIEPMRTDRMDWQAAHPPAVVRAPVSPKGPRD